MFYELPKGSAHFKDKYEYLSVEIYHRWYVDSLHTQAYLDPFKKYLYINWKTESQLQRTLFQNTGEQIVKCG